MTMCVYAIVRGTLVAAFAAAIGLGGAPAAGQQELKFQGPVKVFAGFAAGGSSDLLARIVADKLKDKIGRAVVVDNRTGAGGRIAVEAIKSGASDGSVIGVANISHMSVAPLIFSDLPYDPRKDFAPITKAIDFQIVLATGSQTSATDMKSLLAWLKTNPDKANSGNPGHGSLPHLYGLELATAIGQELRPVPYRGGVPIVAALTSGDLAMGWAATADFIEQHRAGQLRIVGVSGNVRSPQLPEVPTFTEHGFKSIEPNGWIGFFAPAATPPEVVALYNREIVAILKTAAVAERLQSFGFLVTATTAADLKAQIEADIEKWRPVVEKAGMRQ